MICVVLDLREIDTVIDRVILQPSQQFLTTIVVILATSLSEFLNLVQPQGSELNDLILLDNVCFNLLPYQDECLFMGSRHQGMFSVF